MIPRLNVFDKYREYAPLFIRLIIGFHLTHGTWPHVFSYARMLEFADFLRDHGLRFALFFAFLSAYSQFVCGLLFILGAATRYAAVVMIINFIAALIIAHRGDTYAHTFPALLMLSAACFFLFHGAGRLSVDSALAKQEMKQKG